MSLKELTMQQHKNAERQKFASILMSGNIPVISYLRYLVNQHACYNALENHQDFKLPDLRLSRVNNIQSDISELQKECSIDKENMLTQSTVNYIQHVNKNIRNFDDFMAHVYVRYLGDLRGGQMIAKKIPGTGLYYQFQEPDELANSIYRKLNDNMANEAKLVFDYATKLFIEMYDIMTSEKEIK